MRTHVTHPGETPVTRPHARRRYLEAPAKTLPASPDIAHDQIERRAYELYLARGERPGDALGDWLAAERELAGGVAALPPLTKRTGSDVAH